MADDLNTPIATPTGLLAHDGTAPGRITPAQATALLNAFTSALKGLVPASGGGTTNFLRADATWAAPPGGGSAIKPINFPLTAFPGDDVTVGDGKSWFVIPASMNGMLLTTVLAAFDTPGTTGTSDFQLRRRRSGTNADMLSTKVTVDSTEYTSATAAAAAVINTANDDVATGDIIYLDCDAVSTVKPKGGAIVAEFT